MKNIKAVGEVTVDTDKDTVVVHDGSTAGGKALAKEDSPKENLITNSGFDVWSNSTLVTTGSDIKDTTFDVLGTWSLASAHSGGEVDNGRHAGHGNGGANQAFRGNIPTV